MLSTVYETRWAKGCATQTGGWWRSASLDPETSFPKTTSSCKLLGDRGHGLALVDGSLQLKSWTQEKVVRGRMIQQTDCNHSLHLDWCALMQCITVLCILYSA